MRRSLTVLLAVLLLVLTFALWRGLRMPPLRIEPGAWPMQAAADGVQVDAEGAAWIGEGPGDWRFRSYVPEPAFRVFSERETTLDIEIQNVHPDAQVRLAGRGLVRHDGVTWKVALPLVVGVERQVVFGFPERPVYRFAAFGDSGGESAFAAALSSSVDLGADFVLFLGDAGYSDDAFERAEETLRNVPIPVYAAIGNHDIGRFFHWSERFVRTFGPRNSVFTLRGVTFLNLDTSADTWPPMGGERGRLLRRLRAATPGSAGPLVVFMHRPLDDPRVEMGVVDKPHALNRAWEDSWLRENLRALGAEVVLAGHVHANIAFDDRGLPTWISGMGLAHAMDAKGEALPALLVGEFAPDGPVALGWVPVPTRAVPGESAGSARAGGLGGEGGLAALR
ncbi:MAG: metallophosphoesterase [Myxococcota bacterium]